MFYVIKGVGVHRLELTVEEAVANLQLILSEPMLALSARRGDLTIEDMADIADYIRFVRSRQEGRRRVETD